MLAIYGTGTSKTQRSGHFQLFEYLCNPYTNFYKVFANEYTILHFCLWCAKGLIFTNIYHFVCFLHYVSVVILIDLSRGNTYFFPLMRYTFVISQMVTCMLFSYLAYFWWFYVMESMKMKACHRSWPLTCFLNCYSPPVHSIWMITFFTVEL